MRNSDYLKIEDPYLLVEHYKRQLKDGLRSKHKPVICSTNSKVMKNEKEGYLTACIHFSPATESVGWGGTNMCASCSYGCSHGCLKTAGCHAMPYQKVRRIALTLWWLQYRDSFMDQLHDEMKALINKAKNKGLKLAFRPNALSDRRDFALSLVEIYPEVQFYDYTKLPQAWKVHQPGRYHITFSQSETNLYEVHEAMKHGLNVAVVFNGELPDTYLGRPVIDGDLNDARFLDPEGVIVGLKIKGRNSSKSWATTTGFAVKSGYQPLQLI